MTGHEPIYTGKIAMLLLWDPALAVRVMATPVQRCAAVAELEDAADHARHQPLE